MTTKIICDACGEEIELESNNWELGIYPSSKHVHNTLECLEAYVDKLKKEKVVNALTDTDTVSIVKEYRE